MKYDLLIKILKIKNIKSNNDIVELIKEHINKLPKPMFYKKVEVKNSKIEGTGLFALENIKKGEKVIKEQGIIVSNKVIDLIEEIGLHTELCINWNTYLLHAPLDKNQSGYLNHSCDPNIGMLTDREMIAIKDIKINEEIVIDYGFFETDKDWKMQCNCNSKNCRKIITGLDYKILKKDNIKKQYISPYLREN